MERTYIENEKIKKIVKRSMDLGLVFISGLTLVPICIFLFLLIILEQLIRGNIGPLIISEPRISKGKTFPIYKINMFKETDRQKYVNESPMYRKERTYSYLQTKSESLTFIGKLIKKYYLDELAQLFNILVGQMSIVGPRPKPEILEMNAFPPRQLLKSGIFCFENNRAKIEGVSILKYSTDEEYLDLYQRNTVSEFIKLEILIMIDGFKAVISGKGL